MYGKTMQIIRDGTERLDCWFNLLNGGCPITCNLRFWRSSYEVKSKFVIIHDQMKITGSYSKNMIVFYLKLPIQPVLGPFV